MGGGIGFSRQGQDLSKSNRSFLNNRTKLKDNPYSATKITEHEYSANYDELANWHQLKREKADKLRNRIFILLGALVVAGTLLYLFL